MEGHSSSFNAHMEAKAAGAAGNEAGGVEVTRTCESELILELSIQDMKRLTQREWEILELIDMGKDRQDMQRALHISKGTVCTHLRSICWKLKVSNYKYAPLAVRRLGLVATPEVRVHE